MARGTDYGGAAGESPLGDRTDPWNDPPLDANGNPIDTQVGLPPAPDDWVPPPVSAPGPGEPVEEEEAPAAPGPTTPGTTAPTPGYDLAKLKAALLAYNVPASAEALKAFIAAHPEFATGVTIGGSKGNKLYYNGQFLADVIRGTSTSNPAWDWDESTGSSGGDAGQTPTEIDASYLAGYPGDPFEAPEGSDIPDPFAYEDFSAPPEANLPDPFSYADFAGVGAYAKPTAADLYDDPSYQFRRDQAMGALSASASGKGLTNSGGTISDLLGLSSQFASQEYGNVWDRSFKEWMEKYDTAKQTYDTNRKGAETAYSTNLDLAKDEYDQALTTYSTLRGNKRDTYNTEVTGNQSRYDRARDEFDASVKDYYDNRDSAWEKLYKTSALGANVTTAP